MTVYEDEWGFWDDIAGKYILKNAGMDHNAKYIVDAAATYSDMMVLARRKRKAAKIPAGDIPRVTATAESVVAAPMA
ncbi:MULTISPECIES: hypothetical protein [Pseudomonas]|jgi:hypothetical protein|uniref:Uncharacterized protein n=1 Tax=Pseudomonas fluorescens TaxID=294 RepID=A0A5E7AUW1_PSEFL|nr:MULTISPECIES: hypothetical protein [Pseudomonas]MBP5947085.1 hypothetical protein [Pseudomonas sp. P9(2020)]MBP5958795.1 hypothetical protein [Pseudomonas anatoliensis]MBZ9565238.1 hypothetical protein [Pseudomonas sp. P116]VVN83188.1 hypothetical protein PS718_01276 [Pseudomonas fluorescens]VVP09730.1 hypothetical protein PS898_03253 [Pseudomonas fluorescens]